MSQLARSLREALRKLGSPAKAASALRFFKAGPGQYGEGDKFLGVTVPEQRKLVREFRGLPLAECLALLKSPWHEERLTALLLLGDQFTRAKKDPALRDKIAQAYLKHLKWVNNWDLVDSSAPVILGAWLKDRDRSLLYKLVRSKRLWERRVAMVATQHFINAGESADALKLAALLLDDKEDLMHKASGWMLRELGKRVSREDLRAFLTQHAARMPRTMLRYAIEHLPEAERKRWMAQSKAKVHP
jgi:3-methyladenine DNA glycosylase AlkD